MSTQKQHWVEYLLDLCCRQRGELTTSPEVIGKRIKARATQKDEMEQPIPLSLSAHPDLPEKKAHLYEEWADHNDTEEGAAAPFELPPERDMSSTNAEELLSQKEKLHSSSKNMKHKNEETWHIRSIDSKKVINLWHTHTHSTSHTGPLFKNIFLYMYIYVFVFVFVYV